MSKPKNFYVVLQSTELDKFNEISAILNGLNNGMSESLKKEFDVQDVNFCSANIALYENIESIMLY